jgi:uncharacterized tellurite resistance protein B-like protein
MAGFWPSPGDYSSAIQNPRNCFTDFELKNGKPAVNHLGLPVGASGNFAVVYQVTTGTRMFAARCFIRPPLSDQQKRYEELHRHLSGFSIHALVPFSYLPEGIRVRGHGYPLVRMEWINGKQLHKHVAEGISRADDLSRLASRWRGVIAGLRGAHSAHGDLQHGNVLIDPSGNILLVDYDGFFIPALRGNTPGEVGHPNYQHPERIEYGLYDENADNFSALVVYLSLMALRSDPSLWDFHNGENLIFLADDFKRPGRSPIWLRLKTNPDREVQRLVQQLEEFCKATAAAVPDLETVIQALPSRKHAAADAGTGTSSSTGVSLVQRLEQIRALVLVALADGVLSPDEERHIQEQGAKLQVSANDIEKIIREEKKKIRAPQPPIPSPQTFRTAPQPTASGTPVIEISRTQFEFSNVRAGTMTQGSVTVSNTGGGTLQGQIRSNRPWLKTQSHIDRSRHRQEISFNIDTSGLPLGCKDHADIEINSNGGTARIAVYLSVELPEEALGRFRSSVFWVGALIGGAFGFSLYQLLPNNPQRDVIAAIAGFTAILASIVLGARMGKFAGGCGGFFLSAIVLSIIQKAWPEGFSAISWAITFGTLMHATSRLMFIAKQGKKLSFIPVVGTMAIALAAAVIAIGVYVSEKAFGPVIPLEGSWRGSFEGGMNPATSFEAAIHQNGHNISGTIIEVSASSRKSSAGSRINSQFIGTIQGDTITFEKRYSDRIISYAGRLAGDHMNMSGNWQGGLVTGTWEMHKIIGSSAQQKQPETHLIQGSVRSSSMLVGSWSGVVAGSRADLSIHDENGSLKGTISYDNVAEELSIEPQGNDKFLMRGLSYRSINGALANFALDTFSGEIVAGGSSLNGSFQDARSRTGVWSFTRVRTTEESSPSSAGDRTPSALENPIYAYSSGGSNGSFKRLPNGEWEDRSPNGVYRFREQETDANGNWIYLRDDSRGMSVKIPQAGGTAYFQYGSLQKDGIWYSLYNVALTER